MLLCRPRRPDLPRRPRALRLQGAVGRVRQGVVGEPAQGGAESNGHDQQRLPARQAQRHGDGAAKAGEERGALARLRGRQLLPLLLQIRRGRGGGAARRRPPPRRPARAGRRGRQEPHVVQALRGRQDDARRRRRGGLRLHAPPPRLLLRARGGRELLPRRLDRRSRQRRRHARPHRQCPARRTAGGEAERPAPGFPPGHQAGLAPLHARRRGRRGRRDRRRLEHLVRQRARPAGALRLTPPHTQRRAPRHT